jgi:hypothetical protein
VSSITPAFGAQPPRKKRFRFEDLQRFLSCTKIIIVEIASIAGLLAILFEGLKHELKW